MMTRGNVTRVFVQEIMDLKFRHVGMPTQSTVARTESGRIGFRDLLQNQPPLFWDSQFPIPLDAD